MRTVLLDENLPRLLRQELGEHQVATVTERGWSGLANGEILTRASPDFEVFVTADQGIEYQQNLAGAEVGTVIVGAPSNRLEDLLPLADEITRAVDRVRSGELVHVPARE